MEIEECRPRYVVDVILFDKSDYTLENTSIEQLKEVLNKDKFIELNGDLVACNSVKKVCKRLVPIKIDWDSQYKIDALTHKPISKETLEKTRAMIPPKIRY